MNFNQLSAWSIRHPVVQPDRDVRAFQDVLIDLGTRLRLPGLLDRNGAAKYPRGYAQYMVEHERAPGIGLLAGWRGSDGSKHGVGGRGRIEFSEHRALHLDILGSILLYVDRSFKR